MSYTPSEMVADAVGVLAEYGISPSGRERLGELLRRLGRDPGVIDSVELAGLHGSGSMATILATGSDGSVLMLARFPTEAPTPIHDHNSWGLGCVIRGRDHHVLYRHTEGGIDPGRARLEVVEERLLEVGDLLFFGPPPDDIHSQQGVDEAAYELVLFGHDPNALPRRYFDLATGAVEQHSAV
ncbi:MAG TPA: hypothetical protein VLR46_10610 [Candidatus Dormibacteraeota bacterium]|nr:hypothetical protein [Candidatus Dormibacteraeota bacterium]